MYKAAYNGQTDRQISLWADKLVGQRRTDEYIPHEEMDT